LLDDTDFKTAETGLTIANTDVKLIVNGGASADKNSGGGTHRANGIYGLTFDATDTATVGEMEVSIKVAGALPVFMKFWVLEEAVYDMLFGASAIGYIANQPVDVNTIKTQTVTCSGGVTVPAATLASTTNITAAAGCAVSSIGSAVITATSIAADAITDAKVASDVTIASVTGAVGSVTGAVGSVTGNVGGNVTGSVGSVVGAVGSVTGNVGGNVTGSVGSVAAGGITASSIAADAIGASELAADAVAEIAAGVWDLATSGHTTSGTFGAAAVAAGGSGDPWSTSLPGAYGSGTAGYIVGTNIDALISSRASQTSLDTVDDFLDTEVAAILAAVDTEVGAIKAKTDNLPAAPAATGDIPTAAQNAAGLLDLTNGVETGLTVREHLRVSQAAAAGKLSGAATSTVNIRDKADSKNRISATVDADGNRSAVTLDVS
jgi:hypothetical protein